MQKELASKLALKQASLVVALQKLGIPTEILDELFAKSNWKDLIRNLQRDLQRICNSDP